jgi:hypothetical protein
MGDRSEFRAEGALLGNLVRGSCVRAQALRRDRANAGISDFQHRATGAVRLGIAWPAFDPVKVDP